MKVDLNSSKYDLKKALFFAFLIILSSCSVVPVKANDPAIENIKLGSNLKQIAGEVSKDKAAPVCDGQKEEKIIAERIREQLPETLIGRFLWVGYCLLFAFVGRLFMCYLRMLSARNGETEYVDQWYRDDKIYKKRIIFRYSENLYFRFLFPNNLDRGFTDYYLPTMIGLFELIVFPILISLDKWDFIAYWLGLKTAGHWGEWHRTRTTYNRFLLGSVFNLICSYFGYYLFFR
ncbi:MAG: hypothetical protein JXD21_06910 [Candidatus Omnitrophica bacterium]|nr:hypothetical protein [Candidatus Omnitrophota bacterium]